MRIKKNHLFIVVTSFLIGACSSTQASTDGGKRSGLLTKKTTNGGSCLRNEVLRSQLYLQSTHSGTDENIRKIHTGFMNIGGEMLLHANR